MNIVIKTPINKNFRDVFSLFNEKLFRALKPPLVRLEIKRFDGCKKGDEIHLSVSPLSLKTERWISHVTEFYDDDDQIYFVDRGVIIPFPLKSWKHTHRIERVNDDRCLIVDDIEFSCGNLLLDRLLYPILYVMFLCRRPVYKRELS